MDYIRSRASVYIIYIYTEAPGITNICWLSFKCSYIGIENGAIIAEL